MAVKDVFKVNRRTFLDPRTWLGYDALKRQNKTIWNLAKNVLITPDATRAETFEAAIARLEISEESLKEIQNNYEFYAWIFATLGAVAFLFSFYLLFAFGSFAGFILALSTTALFLSQAFRYSFWSFQIKHRKLGCTFDEWRNRNPNKGS